MRRLLNVESGLNDGIATPFVNLFLVGAVSTETAHVAEIGSALRELAVGAGVGIGVGVIGGWLLVRAIRAGWSAPGFRPLAALGLALLAYGSVVREGLEDIVLFAERAGALLGLMVWLLFGAVMVVPGFEAAPWQDYVFAALALTVLRMVPVALALIGSGLDRATVALVGWFGPRGLASVVFGLIAYDSLDHQAAHDVLGLVVVTVTFSVLLHGLTAGPLAARYGAFAAGLVAHRPEKGETAPFRTRPGLEFRTAGESVAPSDPEDAPGG